MPVDTMLILMVEDNPDDEFLALRALRRHGMNNVVIAHDGEEALTCLLGSHEKGTAPLEPALILLDLKLPKIDGIDVLRTLRDDKRTGHIPVIVISSSREECDLSRCRDLGVLGYLTKPVDGGEIVDLLGATRRLGTSPP